jgi:V8-like Glu-specific endopeptidase
MLMPMRTGSPNAILRVAGPLVAVALVCLATLAAASAAAATDRLQPAAGPIEGEVAKVTDYWTPARMRSTRPLDAPLPPGDTAIASFAPIAEPTILPFSVNGRLFVRQGRRRGFCSATAINSLTRRLVLTAAHCVNSGPRGRRGSSAWSRYLEFGPAFSNGVAPFGAFVARRDSVFAPRQWVKFGNPNFDVGAMLTAPNAEGVNVADAVGGGVTIALDRGRRQQFQTFGYPGNNRRLQGCSSPYVGDDATTYRIPGPPTIAIRCHWAPGASGGGWLTEEGTLINGLTSYAKRGDSKHTYGPYFSSRNVGNLVAGL